MNPRKKISIQQIINILLASIAIIISVGSAFGLFETDTFLEKIPNIILFLVGLLIINSTLERRNRLDIIEQKLDAITKLISEDNLSKLHHITKDISPTLQHIFQDFISSFVEFFQDAINNEKIEFNDIERFKSSYIKTLELKQESKSTFLATSLPYKRYFWTNSEDLTPMVKAIDNFTKNGGSFKRIFFYEKGDLEKEEVIAILNKQVDLNIEVILIPIDSVPRRLQKYFVVDDETSFAWEVSIDTRQRINSMAFTTSKNETSKYKSTFHELMNLDDRIDYKKTEHNKT